MPKVIKEPREEDSPPKTVTPQVVRTAKATSVGKGSPSPPKKKINHFQIPKNLHPFAAIELAIGRASKFPNFELSPPIEQQIQIAKIVKHMRYKEFND